MGMSAKERVLCALNLGRPDRIPIFDFIYSRKFYQEVIGKVPEYYNAEDAMNCAAAIGFDLAVIPLGGFSGIQDHATSKDVYQDEWGTTYKQDRLYSWPADAPIGYPLRDRNDWKNYRIPDPSLGSRLREINIAIKMAKETKLAVMGTVRGPFTATWLLFGIEKFSLLLYDEPDFIDEVIKACTDFYIEGGRRMVEAGVDGLFFADDYGTISTPFLSPKLFAKHVLPHLSRMVAFFKRMGVPVVMHSDGNLRILMDLLVGTGINGYHPIERAARMDLKDIKENYGRKICLIGNVNNKTTLVTGTVEEVRLEVLECIRIAGPGGGYILASDHSLKDDMPNENVFALYEFGRRYGTYPLSV